MNPVELQGSERLGLGPAIVSQAKPGVIDPVAIRKLELQPQDAFLLSRIDGPVTYADLALMCGLDEESLAQAVSRLLRMRVLVRLDQRRPLSKTVKVPGSSGQSAPVRPRIEHNSKSLRQRAKTRKLHMLRRQIHSGGRRSEPAERVPLVSVSVSVRTGESTTVRKEPGVTSKNPGSARPRSTTQPVDLRETIPVFESPWAHVGVDKDKIDAALAINEDRQCTLLQMSAVLDQLGPFELLAMLPSNEAGEIRRAFHEQSRWLHPDAYHGKSLGPYRDLLEQVFTKVRQAYETLQCESSRQRYVGIG